ncbi:hypothetical protein SAMN05421786_10938 [Chryseobacterium ureilyticum]|uniref:Uncharacterized protein n=1 Tax=Chryseobacterium ureilyticum TaxID=373668 RepID=A0A1N7QE28_9FLAO|nr:hypothetical protein [Chryseobacterium ureilyticum]SIT21009.1 hypothetical protein SAMN05421786_10938 [Chryseobacterium ureilyticum]
MEAVLEKAKDLGVKGAKEFVTLNANNVSFSGGDQGGVYKTLDISQSILENILLGKIRRLDNLQKKIEDQNRIDDQTYMKSNQSYKSSLNYMLLYKSQYDEKIGDDIYIIETIFIK